MTRSKLDEQACWDAVQARTAGPFFYGVLTSGVYCRPDCASRQPLRKNVRFYSTPAEAEAAGLRPCLRCHPLAAVGLDPNTEIVRDICRFINERSDENIGLRELAAKSGLSPFHLQRSFKAIAGVTPKQYQEACRLRKLKGQLRDGGAVTDAIFDAGFGSLSRVYEKADTRLGMTPAQYRKRGAGLRIGYAAADCPLGRLMIGATSRGICFLQFADSDVELAARLRAEYPKAELEPMPENPCPPEFELWMKSLNRHLAGNMPRLELPVDVRATAFQMKVWQYLQGIPYGEVQSYGEVAAGIGQPSAVRAVARACASNHAALIIPCHRVIRGTGELGGYRWGLERKRILIDRERASKSAANKD